MVPPQPTETFKDYLPLISVIVGGLLAIGGGFSSNYFFEWRKRANEAKRIAYAFRGEIQALQSIVKTRGYIQTIEDRIKTIRSKGQPDPIHIQVKREYFYVFKNNVTNIGSLKNPLPELICRFYIQANSILEDLEMLRDDTWKTANMDLLTIAEELLGIMKATYSLADQIVNKIEKLYGQS